MTVFYRQIITVEMLYRDDCPDAPDLRQIAYDAIDGNASGQILSVETEAVTPDEMVDLLKAQGSDPEFLGLDEERKSTMYLMVLSGADRSLIHEALKEYWTTTADPDGVNELAERVLDWHLIVDPSVLEVQKGLVQAQSLKEPKNGYWDGLANLLEDLCMELR